MSNVIEVVLRLIGDQVSRWIRTLVPVAVAYVATRWPNLARAVGLEDADGATVLLIAFSAWYTLVATLEAKAHPAFGWLLGWRKEAPAEE